MDKATEAKHKAAIVKLIMGATFPPKKKEGKQEVTKQVLVNEVLNESNFCERGGERTEETVMANTHMLAVKKLNVDMRDVLDIRKVK